MVGPVPHTVILQWGSAENAAAALLSARNRWPTLIGRRRRHSDEEAVRSQPIRGEDVRASVANGSGSRVCLTHVQ